MGLGDHRDNLLIIEKGVALGNVLEGRSIEQHFGRSLPRCSMVSSS